MCCGFRNITNAIANIMHMTEKLVSCCAVASVVTCFVLSTVCMIGLGIGIGYNYCVGERKGGADLVRARQGIHQRNLYFTTPEVYSGRISMESETESSIIREFTPSSTETKTASPSITESFLQNKTKSLKSFWRDLMDSNEVSKTTNLSVSDTVGPALTTVHKLESVDKVGPGLSGLDKMVPALASIDGSAFRTFKKK